NPCTAAQMEDVRRFDTRGQWQMSASMLFMVFFPVSVMLRNSEKSAARQARRDEEQHKEVWTLRTDLRKEQRQTRKLQEELIDLKREIAPYRAEKEAQDQKEAQEAAQQQAAAQVIQATQLQEKIGVSKPLTLKRK